MLVSRDFVLDLARYLNILVRRRSFEVLRLDELVQI